MTRRNRKLIGAFTVIIYVVIYALVAMALAQARVVQDATGLVQGLVYAVLGLSWIVPLMPQRSWNRSRMK